MKNYKQETNKIASKEQKEIEILDIYLMGSDYIHLFPQKPYEKL